VSCAVILASSFVPEGAFSFNPRTLGTVIPEGAPEGSDSELESMDAWKEDISIKEDSSIYS
jgi:hypothetical protein